MEEKVILNARTVLEIVRLEKDLKDYFKPDVLQYVEIFTDFVDVESCKVTLNDIETALHNMKTTPITYKKFCSEYFLFLNRFSDKIIFADYDELALKNFLPGSFPATESEFLYYVFHYFQSFTVDFGRCAGVEVYNDDETSYVDCDLILSDIERFKNGQKVCPWNWNYRIKKILAGIAFEFAPSEYEGEALENNRGYLDELIKNRDADGLNFAAYSYYGGNNFYECNFDLARDTFLELMDREDVDEGRKLQYANALGCIFYYGHCNNGEPEYDKAFYCFSIGAAGGFVESRYKIADMFMNGYGVEKNMEAARRIIVKLYEETEKDFYRGNWGCGFADVCLRMGNLYRTRILKDEKDCDYAALHYYTLAEYAIKLRMKYCINYGDKKVYEDAARELSSMRFAKNVVTPSGKPRDVELIGPRFIYEAFRKNNFCMVTFEKKGANVVIRARRIALKGNEQVENFVELDPYEGICHVTDETAILCEKAEKVTLANKSSSFLANDMSFNRNGDKSTLAFYFLGNKVASLVCAKYIYREEPEDFSAV